MKNNDAIISHLNSTFSKLIILATAFMAQVPHTIAVFTEGQRCADWGCLASYDHLPAVAAGISLEGGILFVLLRGWHGGSYAFAGVSVLVNVAYYALVHHGGDAQALTWIEALKSVIVPGVIAVYSHLLADTPSPVASASRASKASLWIRCKSWVAMQVARLRKLGDTASESLQDAQDSIAEPLQDAADDLATIIASLQGDAKENYLHLRKLGKWGNAEICNALQIKTGTGSSWWNRAQAHGAGD